MITAESQLLRRVIDGQIESVLKYGFDPSILHYPYNEAAEILVDFYRQHDQLPSVPRFLALCTHLGDVPIAEPGEAPSNATVYWEQISKTAMRSALHNTLEDISEAYNKKKMDSPEFIDFAVKTLAKLASKHSAHSGGPVTLGNMADELWSDFKLTETGDIPGIPIPEEFLYLKRTLVKFEPAQITTLVSRRSVGKTWKGLIFSLYGAQHNEPVLIASMEMARRDLARRLAALASGLDFDQIKKGTLDRTDRLKYQKFLSEMAKGKGFWDCLHIMEPREIRSVFAVESRAHSVGAKMVFADAFYLWPAPQEERWQRIESNLSDVRAVSLDTDRHWLLTAQFNKQARGLKTSDEFAIGGSDSFNQDSNNIIHLVQRKMEKKNKTVIFELAKGRDCEAEPAWVHHWNFRTMKRGPISVHNTEMGDIAEKISAAQQKAEDSQC
ncbi:MAG: DnaB-like helicase C-terminal domain-containing protein [Planctomycetota bacterium]|jgi:hypothetical protein